MNGFLHVITLFAAVYIIAVHLLPMLFAPRGAHRRVTRRGSRRATTITLSVVRETTPPPKPAVSTHSDPGRPTYFAEDGSRVRVNGQLHVIHDPALRDLTRALAASRAEMLARRSNNPAADLVAMWEALGQPELAARERSLQRLAAEERSLRHNDTT